MSLIDTSPPQDHGAFFAMAPPPMHPNRGPPQQQPPPHLQAQAQAQAQAQLQAQGLGPGPAHAPGSMPGMLPQGMAPGMAQGLSPAQQGLAVQQWDKVSFANFDWSLYDYHPADDGGFWQLQPDYPPSDTLPSIIPLAVTNRSPVQQAKDIEWTCLSAACPSKPFKRKVDLDRHYKQAHADGISTPVAALGPPLPMEDVTMTGTGPVPPQVPATKPAPKPAATASTAATASPPPQDSGTNGKDVKDKEKEASTFYCDYAACPRRTEGFSRKDRFRTHLQETHKEDVNKKGAKIEDSWLDGRKMSNKWWRCTRCLDRIKIDEHGWECPKDNVKCEKRRREYREKM
ncbi:hypothetical protein ACHAQA_002313 [Verticillium albo-atrum]